MGSHFHPYISLNSYPIIMPWSSVRFFTSKICIQPHLMFISEIKMEKEELFKIKIIKIRAYHRVQVWGGCKLKPSVDFESKPRKTTTTDITKTTVTKIFVEKYDKVLLLFGFFRKFEQITDNHS